MVIRTIYYYNTVALKFRFGPRPHIFRFFQNVHFSTTPRFSFFSCLIVITTSSYSGAATRVYLISYKCAYKHSHHFFCHYQHSNMILIWWETINGKRRLTTVYSRLSKRENKWMDVCLYTYIMIVRVDIIQFLSCHTSTFNGAYTEHRGTCVHIYIYILIYKCIKAFYSKAIPSNAVILYELVFTITLSVQ